MRFTALAALALAFAFTLRLGLWLVVIVIIVILAEPSVDLGIIDTNTTSSATCGHHCSLLLESSQLICRQSRLNQDISQAKYSTHTIVNPLVRVVVLKVVLGLIPLCSKSSCWRRAGLRSSDCTASRSHFLLLFLGCSSARRLVLELMVEVRKELGVM